MTHYEAKIAKKLRIKEPNSSDIINLMKKEDINIEENYVFHKKLIPENMQNLSYLNFQISMKNSFDTKEKYILLINEDEKMNRNVMTKLNKISKKNPEVNFYYMYSTPENEGFLKERFNLEFKKYPQMFVYYNDNDNDNEKNKFNNKINLISEKTLLSFNTSLVELNGFVNRLI